MTFFALKLEPIPLFTIVIGFFICEFSIRGLSLERIYRELRGPDFLVHWPDVHNFLIELFSLKCGKMVLIKALQNWKIFVKALSKQL